jgi:hypothetical protein
MVSQEVLKRAEQFSSTLLRSSIATRGEAAHFSGMLGLADKRTSGAAAFEPQGP